MIDIPKDNRLLDIKIAELIFGFVIDSTTYIPFYSSDIEDAWGVCAAMEDDDYFGISLETLYKASSEDAARRICEEALKAVDHKKQMDELTPEQREYNRSINILGD